MADRANGRSAGAAVVTGDQYHVGFGFGDARSDGAHSGFGNQFDADARLAVGIF